MNCPVCGGPIEEGHVLLCERCWWKTKPQDRVLFWRLWSRNGPKASQSKGEQMIRDLKARLAPVCPVPDADLGGLPPMSHKTAIPLPPVQLTPVLTWPWYVRWCRPLRRWYQRRFPEHFRSR